MTRFKLIIVSSAMFNLIIASPCVMFNHEELIQALKSSHQHISLEKTYLIKINEFIIKESYYNFEQGKLWQNLYISFILLRLSFIFPTIRAFSVIRSGGWLYYEELLLHGCQIYIRIQLNNPPKSSLYATFLQYKLRPSYSVVS